MTTSQASGLSARLGSIGLRTRLLAAALLLAIPAAAFLAYLAYTGYQGVQQRGRDRVLDAAQTAANGAEEFLAFSETLLTGIAAHDPIELLDPSSCSPRVIEASEMLAFFEDVTVLDARGATVCTSVAGLAGAPSYSDRPWFASLASGDPFVTSVPLGSPLEGTFRVALASGISSEDGSFRGAVTAGLAIDALATIVRDAVPDQGAIITITDSAYTVLSRTQDLDSWRNRNIGNPAYPDVAAGPGWVIFRSGQGDGERTVGRVDLPDRGWMIYASIDDDELYTAGLSQALGTGAAGLLLLVLALVGAGFVHRGLADGVQELVDGIHSASTERLVPVPVSAPPEIREVADQFNHTLMERARAEERFLAFFHQAPFAASITTDDGRVIAVNESLAESLGYPSAKELSEQGPAALYPAPEDRERLMQHFREAGVLNDYEVTLLHKDGSPVLMRISGRRVEDERGARLEIMGEDITERRRLEEAERHRQKTEALSRLAGGVSHEINNVLTVIAGNAGVVEGDLGPEHPSYRDVREISKAVVRGTELTKSLLAISRKDVAPPTDLDVPAVVSEVEVMLARLLPESIHLTSECGPTPHRVRMSRSHFEQMMLNLVVNARDALPDGGTVHIRTATETAGDGATVLSIAVEDDGTGIEPALVEKIFEPYFTTKPRGGGTGLGLATVQGVVAQAGGTLDVESEVGVGTRFVARFPTVPAD